ncbi:ABC transporter ATP-binding protein [Kibdelosporangium philippinense]|uniref:ABC transporter ATP-binding protein n=1 Tax=Kibdelosporangium philippinense TaxID=211113 RepID=A0ABS8Z5C4_9PSEU|nr:ABC transporter ATP-binding protein [Kibdelosporangium philippinense]MCE7003109.1 ABC transporter ATP-binding protein [Kibdelosporangium philippinense]
MLEVSDLTVDFPSENGPVRAVRGLSYEVSAGEVLGIVGESGSGKSASSLAVMGLLQSKARVSGSVRFRDRELIGLSDRELSQVRGRRIAMVFQDPMSALTPVYTVGDQIAEALLIHGMSRQQAANRAVELLDLVGIPNAARRAGAFPHEFSGGMRQRVVIAIAIANNPDLIIADEPTTALDVTVQAQVLDVLKTAQQVTGAGVVLITHDLGVIAGFADRVVVMYAGRAVETGLTDEIFYQPRMPYTIGLLGSLPRLDATSKRPLLPIAGQPPSLVDLPPGCSFAPRCPMMIDACRSAEPELDSVDGAHRAACIRIGEISPVQINTAEQPEPLKTPRAHRDVVLAVDGLVKHFPLTKGTVFKRKIGTVRAVDGISFDIVEGETLALVGESGCGKTTTLMEILNLEPAVEILGTPVATLSTADRKAIRRDVQVVFQDPTASLDPRMPARDILAEPLQVHGYPRDAINNRVTELLDLVGLNPQDTDRYPAEFSGGQRQRIGIARALALNPKLIVLDEPVSSLDVSIQAGVLNLLDKLKARLGLSYLFVTHNLSVVRHLADRIAVMYLGKIVEIGDVSTVFDAPCHPYTQALLSAIPIPDPATERKRERIVLTGDLPAPASGCRFLPRCFKYAALAPARQALCADSEPELTVRQEDHQVACHYATPREVF